jgi:flagellar biosynthetic protein FliR
MTVHLANLSSVVIVYALVFARTSAMIMLLPSIGDAAIPSRVRLALALAVSFALAPVVAHAYPQQAPQSSMAFGLMLVQEVTAGLLIGLMSRIIMSALTICGKVIAAQTGLSYAQSIDPAMGEQSAIIGNFLSLLGAVLIFATDLHHLAIGAIQGSYTLIPPGAALPTGDMAELAVRLVSGAFALGLQLAAPFIVFAFTINAATGLLARMMPQMQVFFVAMPINVLFGFMLMALLIGSMMTVFLNFYATQMANFG